MGRVVVGLLVLLTATPTAGAQRGGAGGPVARWIGQDGKDFVGPNNRFEPSDVQDVHIALGNLDPNREITYVDILADGGKHAQWEYNVYSFSWKIALERPKSSTTADLYIEPAAWEGARDYKMMIRYDDGAEHRLILRGRKVDSRLRTAEAALKVAWVGQDGFDAVGPGPQVGPDGKMDVRLRLSGVSQKVPIRAIRIDGPGGEAWESGVNPRLFPLVEFWKDPNAPGEGDLFFQPDADLNGKTLRVRILYNNDTTDQANLTAGRSDPNLEAPQAPAPEVHFVAGASARWLGQDGQDVNGPGDVHVAISGLGDLPELAGAVLTNSVRAAWIYQAPGDDRVRSSADWGEAQPLAIKPGATPGALDLYFPPNRDEAGGEFTLRLVGKAGQSLVVQFPGGACDPSLRIPGPDSNRAEAKPGDDLQTLVDRGGVVNLSPGDYRLSQPLILKEPVVLTAESGGATLTFSQPPDTEPWTTAIKIHRGRTTLNGFAVRFEGPVRWNQRVSYGPAVIGTTDDQDQNRRDLKVGVVLTKLDLRGPESSDPSKWTEAVRLMRFTNCMGGRVEGNTLFGGPIEFFGGPWRFVDNECRGTPAKTFSWGVLTGHYTRDVLIQGNRVKPTEPGGKIWRFLVLTHFGNNPTIEKNVVEGVGSIEGEDVPSLNAPEIILTESYRVSYEGQVRPMPPDDRVIRLGRLQGAPIQAGDVVSILTGPAAGRFIRVSQPIDQTTLLLDEPMPPGSEVVSVARGFLGARFAENRVDIRGSRGSSPLILPGNHFGTIVEKNHLLGGAESLMFASCATETPIHWGWTRAPVLGVVVRGNIFEDAPGGANLGVLHDPKHIKVNTGRVYMSAAVHDNLVRWTDPFIARHARLPDAKPLRGLSLGYPKGRDAGEFQVSAARNAIDAPPGRKLGATLFVNSAEYNQQPMLEKAFALPRKGEDEP